ncbi:magnesium/cobalt transporter CorA [Sulfurospirillum sp. 1307]
MKEKIGLSPGSAIYTGTIECKEPAIRLISYNEDTIILKDQLTLKKLMQFLKTSADKISWIHVEPISDQEKISEIGNAFSLHPLVVEDILSVTHRPKAEEFDEYTFVIFKSVSYDKGFLDFSQISFVLKDNNLISFADLSEDRFDSIVKRLYRVGSRTRKYDIEYLFFTLIDYIVDGYFKVLEEIGDEIEDLEDEILNNPSQNSINKIHKMKQTLMNLKKNIWPMREVINALMHSEKFDTKYNVYIRDVYEHVINIMDIIENYKDTTSGFLDIYLSALSNRMNEIMKTLSIISTIFIPLSFLTGYFGMNFISMSEGILKSNDSYIYTNIIMLIIPIVLIAYFKIRKWF